MSETVTIGNRTFRVGATYAAKLPGPQTPARAFAGLDTDRWGGTYVQYRLCPPRHGRMGGTMSKSAWSSWAGEEIEP